MLIGLDYFDASINRVTAWIVGTRNMKKALLYALSTPYARMKALQDSGAFTELMVVSEALKTAPFGDIWAEFCRREGVPEDGGWFNAVKEYEEKVLQQR